MRTAALVSAVTALMMISPAMAADGLALPPSGTTLVNMSVTETTKMKQDTLNASLRIEYDGKSSQEIQDKINKAMASAVAEAKAVPEVKTTTGSYYVYAFDEQPVDPNTGKPTKAVKKWRGNQTIELESKDATKLLELTGKIQTAGFAINGLNYSLSPEKADTARDQLLTKAIKSLGDKAKVAQSALGKGSYEIVDLSVDGASAPVQPVMYKAMAMRAESSDAVAAPIAEAGETDVGVSVTGRILMKP